MTTTSIPAWMRRVLERFPTVSADRPFAELARTADRVIRDTEAREVQEHEERQRWLSA